MMYSCMSLARCPTSLPPRAGLLPTVRARVLLSAPQQCARHICHGKAENNETVKSEDQGGALEEVGAEVDRFTKMTASTFAPRPSGPAPNPAPPGSILYTVFEVQAWAALVVGGLLSYNVLLPSDHADIPRLIGMWSIWIFTVPSLRARQCSSKEKEALNYLFLAIPLVNIAIPFVVRSFPLVFTCDLLLLAGMYAWKGVKPLSQLPSSK
ncbi:CPLD33 [Auxenochlorella protothecoides x Auxenochlorella symbiontica]